MSYGNDFPTSWPGCDLIVGFSSSVPTKKGVLIAHSMKSKERLWVLTKEDPIHKVKKDHEGLKSQKEGKRKK